MLLPPPCFSSWSCLAGGRILIHSFGGGQADPDALTTPHPLLPLGPCPASSPLLPHVPPALCSSCSFSPSRYSVLSLQNPLTWLGFQEAFSDCTCQVSSPGNALSQTPFLALSPFPCGFTVVFSCSLSQARGSHSEWQPVSGQCWVLGRWRGTGHRPALTAADWGVAHSWPGCSVLARRCSTRDGASPAQESFSGRRR